MSVAAMLSLFSLLLHKILRVGRTGCDSSLVLIVGSLGSVGLRCGGRAAGGNVWAAGTRSGLLGN